MNNSVNLTRKCQTQKWNYMKFRNFNFHWLENNFHFPFLFPMLRLSLSLPVDEHSQRWTKNWSTEYNVELI